MSHEAATNHGGPQWGPRISRGSCMSFIKNNRTVMSRTVLCPRIPMPKPALPGHCLWDRACRKLTTVNGVTSVLTVFPMPAFSKPGLCFLVARPYLASRTTRRSPAGSRALPPSCGHTPVGVRAVNSGSKWKVSSGLPTAGLKGGLISFRYSFCGRGRAG